MTGRTGHDVSPDVEAAVREVDRAADALKSALATLAARLTDEPGKQLCQRCEHRDAPR